MQKAFEPALVRCAAAFLIVAMGACDTGETPPLGEFDAIAYGRVETRAGQPVLGAHVGVLAHFERCSDSTAVSQGVATTDEHGFYQQFIKDFTASEVVCVTAVVNVPPIDENTRDADTTVFTSIRLKPGPPSIACAWT